LEESKRIIYLKTFIQHCKELELQEVKRTPALLSALLATSMALGSPGANSQIQKPLDQSTQVWKTTSEWKVIISKFEGFRTEAYWDATGKVWTIGKGSTTHPDGRPVRKGDRITKQQADQYLEHYVNTKIIPKLKMIPNWNNMNANQQSALISFAYNVGPSFYGRSGFESITTALSSPSRWNQVPSALAKYNTSKGKVLSGLTKRRKAEGDLWKKANG
jgi:GH24 family phage-related lysozyme (muramidase)